MRNGEVLWNLLCLPAPVRTTSKTANITSAYPGVRTHLCDCNPQYLYGSPQWEESCGHEAAGRPLLAVDRSVDEVTPAIKNVCQGYTA